MSRIRRLCTVNARAKGMLSVERIYDGEGLEGTTSVLLHGLLGAGRNWRSFAKELVKRTSSIAPGCHEVWLADLRNHGKTASMPADGFEGPHDISSTADDVRKTFRSVLGKAPDVLIGHSLSGKVVLQYLRETMGTKEAPKHVWVLDSIPGISPDEGRGHRDVSKVLAKLSCLPERVPSRAWLYRELRKDGFSEELALWMGSNLKNRSSEGAKGGLAWTFRLEGVRQMYESYLKSDYWDVLEHTGQGTVLHVVRAERSDRWDARTMERLELCLQRNPSLRLHVLKNAGHWLHTDNPNGLLDLMINSR